MKKRQTKKDFKKFTKRNTHKRRDKEKGKRELLKIAEELGFATPSLKVSSKVDLNTRGKKSKTYNESIITGVYSSTKSGFGFVTPSDPKDYKKDVFIPEGRSHGAIDGDLVEIAFHTYESGFAEKTEGRVTKIISYGRKILVGTVDVRYRYGHRRREFVLVPDNDRIYINPIIRDLCGAKEGDKVVALIVRDKEAHSDIFCDVIENLGEAYSKEANYKAVLYEYGIEEQFSEKELSEAEFFSSLPISEEGRVDRRDELILTMDGADAKDLDDAVSLIRTRTGYLLGVHIADVSYYVRERTALDRAAFSRGTSVYFTDKVVPMLPPSLSNGACSLNANEDKYAISALISLDREANIRSVKIEPSIIRSRLRGVYSEINSLLMGVADAEIKKKYKPVHATLLKMQELYEILDRKSKERGKVDFESAEARVILDRSGAPCDVIKRERGISEKIIEEFMILANEAVATYLYEKKIPCVYRVHEQPSAEKLDSLIDFLHAHDFDATYISHDKKSAKDLARVVEVARERGIGAPVSYVMLRSMAKARYSDAPEGHFGLSLTHYCHFTSPIRRLSDLITHRIIRRVIFEEDRAEKYASLARRAAAAATDTELSAVSAERKIENLYKTIYMEGFIGEVFEGIICSVTSQGFYVELPNTVEGLVPISTLFGSFVFDEKSHTLRRGREVYRLGEPIRVRLTEADVINARLTFEVY